MAEEYDWGPYDRFIAGQRAKGVSPSAPPSAAVASTPGAASVPPPEQGYDQGLRSVVESAQASELTPAEEAARAAITRPGVIPGGFKAGLYGGGAGIAKTLGFDDTAKSLQDEARRVAPELDPYKVKGLRSGALYAAGLMSSGAGSILPVAAGTIAGGVAGTAVGGPVGGAVGAYTGGAAAAFPMAKGEFLLNAEEKGFDSKDPRVIQEANSAAIESAALEALVPAALSPFAKIGKVAGRGAAAAGRAAPAGPSFGRSLATRTPAGFAAEAGTEGAQEVSSLEAMARLTGEPVDYSSPEVKARLINAIIGGGLVGGGMGAVSSLGDLRLPTRERSTSSLTRGEDGRLPPSVPLDEEAPEGAPPGGGGIVQGLGAAARGIYERFRPGAAAAAAPAGRPPPTSDLYQDETGVPLAAHQEAAAARQVTGQVAAVKAEMAAEAAGVDIPSVATTGEAVGATARRAADTIQAGAAPAGEAVGRAARRAVDEVGNLRDALTEGWRAGTVSAQEAGAALDAGMAQALETAPEEAKPSVVAQSLIGDGPFTAKEPSAQADVLTKPEAEVSNSLSGGTIVPNTVPPGQEGKWLAANHQEIGAKRTEMARHAYDSLPEEVKRLVGANPVFNDPATQAKVADAYQQHSVVAKTQRLRGAAARSLRKKGRRTSQNREFTQNEYAIRDSVEKALFDREQQALDASGLGGDALIHALAKAKARSTTKANEYAAAIRDVFAEPEARVAITRPDRYGGPGERLPAMPAGRTLVPDQDMIHVYSELLADVRSAPAAQAVFDQAKRLYNSNVDTGLLQTVGDNAVNMVQEYVNTINPNTYFSKGQAKQLLALIQSALAGSGTGGLDRMRTAFMATFGGSPNTFEALVSRIHALNRQVLVASVRESSEGPVTQLRYAPEGGGQLREPGGFGARLAPDEADLTAQEAVETEAARGAEQAEATAEERAGLPDTGFGAQEEELLPVMRIGSKEAMLPTEDEGRVASVLEGIRSGAFGDVTARALTIDEAVDAITDAAKQGDITLDAAGARNYVLNELLSSLQGSRSPQALEQRTELEAALESARGYDAIADKYTIFVMEPRVEQQETLPQMTVERLKRRTVDKGSAEHGTLSLVVPWRGGKSQRQEFSAVELTKRMLGMSSRLRDQIEGDIHFGLKLARAFSRGLGALAQSTGATGLFAQVPKPVSVTGVKLPPAMVETARMVGTKFDPGRRIGLEMLISPAYQDSMLAWLSGVVPRGQFDRQIPDANVQLGNSTFTLQVSSSMMQVVDRNGVVVAGPQLRNDLLVYRTKEGKNVTVGDLAEAVDEVNREANAIDFDNITDFQRDAINKAFAKYGDPMKVFRDGVALPSEEKDALPYSKKLRSLESWVRKSQSWRGRNADLFHYTGPTKAAGDRRVAIGDKAMHETRLVQRDLDVEDATYADPQTGELRVREGAFVPAHERVAQAEVIETPRMRTLRIPGTKAEELLGLNVRKVERQTDTRPVKLDSKDPADWPMDVRERVETVLDPLWRAHVRVQGKAGAERIESKEAFVRRVLSEKGATQKTKPVVAANEVLDRYYDTVKRAEARAPAEGQGAYTVQQRTVAATPTQREPELETLEFMRQTARTNEAERRSAYDEFGAPLYPTKPETRPTAMRVLGALDRAENAVKAAGAGSVPVGAKRVFARVREVVKEGKLNDQELRILGGSIANNATSNIPAIGSVITELGARAGARAKARKVLKEGKRVLTPAEMEAIGAKPLAPDEMKALSDFDGWPQGKVVSPGPLTDITEEALRAAAGPEPTRMGGKEYATERVIRASQEFMRLRNEVATRSKQGNLTAADRIFYRNALRDAVAKMRAEQAVAETISATPRPPEAESVRAVEGEVLPAETVPEGESSALRGAAVPPAGAPRAPRKRVITEADQIAAQERAGMRLKATVTPIAPAAPKEDFGGTAPAVEAPTEGELYRAELNQITAAVVTDAEGKITETAPVWRKFVGQPVEKFQKWVEGKGGKVARMGEAPAAPTAAPARKEPPAGSIKRTSFPDYGVKVRGENIEGMTSEEVAQSFGERDLASYPVSTLQKMLANKQSKQETYTEAATTLEKQLAGQMKPDDRMKARANAARRAAVVIGQEVAALKAAIKAKGAAAAPAAPAAPAASAAPVTPAVRPKRTITQDDIDAAQERERSGGAPAPEGKPVEASLTSRVNEAAASGADTILLPEGAKVAPPPGFAEPIPGHFERRETPNVPREASVPIIPMYYKMPPIGLRSDLREAYPKGTTTAQLIADGRRTATTRAPFAKVGDRFAVRGVPDKVFEVTAIERVDLKTPEGRERWSQREGWDAGYAERAFPIQVRTGAMQTVFKEVSAAQAPATIHSGGAEGADTAFGKIGAELGLDTIAHSFAGHRPTAGSGRQQVHSPAELKAADSLLSKINKKYLNRRFPPGSEYVANLLRRNYYQVRDSEAVIAVSNIGTDGVVQGGTGWAAYMGVELGKPTYVFDQTSRRWHQWKDGDWHMTGVPPPYQSFAGVGSRELELHGERAIRDYLEQFKSGPKTLVQPGDGRVPRETMDAIIKEIKKLLGDKVRTAWTNANFGASGEWIADSQDAFAGVIRLAVSAADAMGVAHHEAMHALLTRLQAAPGGQKVIDALIAATSTPEVVRQLRAALRGHPQAQAQLADPMERITYAYQFYRANPKGFSLAPPARSFFRKMVDFLRSVTGFISDTQRAERVFEAFSEGMFVSPPLMNEFVQNQLEGMGSPAFWAKLQRHPVAHAVQKIMYTGDSLLRESGIPALAEIAERIQNRVGGSGGFLPERMRVGSQWVNRFFDVVRGASETELATAHRNMMLKKPPASPLERELRKLLDDFYTYLNDAGVQQFSHMEDGKPVYENIPYRRDYYHNLWVPEEIAANRPEFERLLAAHGFENPGQIAEDIISGMNAEDNIQGNFREGYTPLFGGASARKLDALYDDPRSLKYRSKSMVETMHRYLWQGVHRAEHTRHFGHAGSEMRALAASARGQGATDKQIDAAIDYIMAAEGTLGATIDPQLRRFFGGVTVYQNFRILPLALFSQVVDPLGIVVRGGTFRDAANAYVRGIKAAFKGLDESEIAEISRLTGVIDDKSALESLGQIYGSVHLSPGQRRINDAFFRMIGLTGWNNGMRVSATEAALSFLKRQLQAPGRHTERWLEELGLEPGDIQMNERGDRIRLFADEGLHPDQARRVQQAVNRWVNEAIVRPTAADRPIWASSPYFALIFYLKQFTYSFQKYIINRTLTEARHGNFMPAAALATAVPTMIAADMARALIQGAGEEPDWRKKWTTMDYVKNGVQRAGLTGSSQFAFDAVEDARRGNVGAESLAGPTIGQGLGALQVLAGKKELSSFLVNAMPGQVIYKGWL